MLAGPLPSALVGWLHGLHDYDRARLEQALFSRPGEVDCAALRWVLDDLIRQQRQRPMPPEGAAWLKAFAAAKPRKAAAPALRLALAVPLPDIANSLRALAEQAPEAALRTLAQSLLPPPEPPPV